MFPAVLKFGYRFFITEELSVSATAGGGSVYMSTAYTNASFQKTTKSTFEPVFNGTLYLDYSLTENLSVSAGGGYYSIYEESSMKNFGEAFLSISYRIF